MNIDDYRYITTIAELGSFTKAAQSLFIAQPSLSQRVKHIEKSYDINIFTRDAKGVQLTKEGECFVKHAKKILVSESDLRREIADMHNPENKVLKIGTTQLMHSYLFDRLIQQLYKEHPNMQFAFYEQNSYTLQDSVLAGDVDIAIAYLPITNEGLSHEVVFHDNYVLVPANEGALANKLSNKTDNEPITFDEIKDEPFAVALKGTRLANFVHGLEDKHGTKMNIQHYMKQYTMLYAMAKSGMASTILYESFFDPNENYLPFYYLEDDEEVELDIAVMWRKGAYLQSSAKELIRIAKELSTTF